MTQGLNRQQVEMSRGRIIEDREDTQVLRVLNDFELVVDKHDVSVTPSLRTHGYWEAWITSWFTRNVERGMEILDIGANCGYYTMLSQKLAGPFGKVVAYECNPRYVELLEETARRNEALFEIRPLALSNIVGTVDLIFPGNYTGSASIVYGFDPKWGEEHSIRVPTTTLNLELDNEVFDNPDIVKIDAESAEELIWDGGTDVWALEHPPIIVLEYSPTGTYSKEFDQKLFDYGTVTRIGYNGVEEPIGPEHLKGLTDWDMLVIRRRT